MLTVVFGGLECLQRSVEPGSPIARHADMAMRGAMSCADLTRRLLGFARRHPLQQKPLDLNSEIARVWELLCRMLGTNMQIRHDGAVDLWTVVVDPMQIEAALVNLVVNARDAMTDNGDLTISTRNRVVDRESASCMGILPGDYVELAVSDTGSGMSAEIREQAFDPFFTTKQPGKGTGLGLSTIYGFIRQSNGGVTIESEIGQGTVIRLYLPRVQSASVISERAEVPVLQPVNARLKVLVVDDDREVLNVAVALLEHLGYAVVGASDGFAGLSLIKSDPTISLLFTDLAMPGMDGHQLAAKAREMRPDLSILFTSGNAKEFPPATRKGSSITFVSKPYRQHDLDAAVRMALSGDPGR